MALKKILSPVSDALDKVCSVAIVIMLGLMVVITTAQIICRTFFTSLSWSDEVTRYLLIWSTFLGATCVYRHSGNIAITFIQDLVPKKLGAVMRIAVHAICCFLVRRAAGFQRQVLRQAGQDGHRAADQDEIHLPVHPHQHGHSDAPRAGDGAGRS